MQHRKLLENLLSVFNLTDNCKKLYIASFEHGELSIGRLADLMDMDRSSAYLAIEQLKSAGLIEVDETKRPKLVRAIEPRRIVGWVERRIQNYEEVFNEVHNNLPALESAYKSSSPRPVMQAYNGKEGLNQIVEDILASESDEIMLFTNPAAEKVVFTEHDHDYFIRRRKQKNLKIRVIATPGEASKKLQEEDNNNLRTTKIISGEPFTSEVYIYGSSVAMLSFEREVIGFIINSKHFAENLKWQFEEIWKGL